MHFYGVQLAQPFTGSSVLFWSKQTQLKIYLCLPTLLVEGIYWGLVIIFKLALVCCEALHLLKLDSPHSHYRITLGRRFHRVLVKITAADSSVQLT